MHVVSAAFHSAALEVGVNLGPNLPDLVTLRALKAAVPGLVASGQAVADECALAAQVSGYDVYLAVTAGLSSALAASRGGPHATAVPAQTAEGGDVAGVGAMDVAAARRSDVTEGRVLTEVATCGTTDAEVQREGDGDKDAMLCGHPDMSSTEAIGVSLRFLLRFASRHPVGSFRKWERDAMSTLNVCQTHIVRFAPTPSHLCARVCPGCAAFCFCFGVGSADCSAHVCKRSRQVPETRQERTAYAALGHPHVLASEHAPPTHFVSHSWGCPFASLVSGLFVHQLGEEVAWAALEETVDLPRLQALAEKHLPATSEHFYCASSSCPTTRATFGTF